MQCSRDKNTDNLNFFQLYDSSSNFTWNIGRYLISSKALTNYGNNTVIKEPVPIYGNPAANLQVSRERKQGFVPYQKGKVGFQPYQKPVQTDPAILQPPVVTCISPIKPKAIKPMVIPVSKGHTAPHVKVVSPSNIDAFLNYPGELGNAVFQCKRCGYMTMWRSALLSHMKIHKNTWYECVVCTFKTKRKQVYKVHMKGHQSILTYHCHHKKPQKCNFSTRQKTKIHLHLQKHSHKKMGVDRNVFKCRKCLFKTTNKNIMIRHKHFRHTKKAPSTLPNLPCSIPNLASSIPSLPCSLPNPHMPSIPHIFPIHPDTDSSSSPHSSSSNEQTPYNFTSEFEENTSKFYMSLHFGLFPLHCMYCSYVTADKSKLSEHMKKHTVYKTVEYRCPECTYSSKWKQMLVTHMKKHKTMQEKLYSCTICGYKTRHKNALTTHVRIHSDDRRYQCHLCEYSAIQKVHLDVHMYKHNGILPFKCTLCKYRTATKASLKAHMCTHTGVKPHKCEFCDYRSARKADLKKHVAIRHHDNLIMQQINMSCKRGRSV